MIQRIQTVYLLLSIILMTVISFWGDLFIFITDEASYHFTALGIDKYTLDNKFLIEENSIPIFIISLILAVAMLYTLFCYKNLKKQLAIAKVCWYAYILLIISVIAWKFWIVPETISGTILLSHYSYAFYLLLIGFPLLFLAIIQIGKDKKKIESIDRIR